MPTSGKKAELTFKISIGIEDEYVSLIMSDIKSDKIYQTGFLDSNDAMAILDFRNYKENTIQLSFGVITVNLGSHMNGIYKGSMFVSNNNSITSSRKCLISKELFEWNDLMREELNFSDVEIDKLKNTDILEIDTNMREDYEINHNKKKNNEINKIIENTDDTNKNNT